MAADAAVMVMSQQPQAPASIAQLAPTRTPPATQPVPQTTGPDVVIEEEVVEVQDEGEEHDQAEEDEETAILSMIQAYQVAEAPPLTPDTSCLTCCHTGRG